MKPSRKEAIAYLERELAANKDLLETLSDVYMLKEHTDNSDTLVIKEKIINIEKVLYFLKKKCYII